MSNLQAAVYRIQNLDTGNYYIGSTHSLKTRLNNHFSYLRRNTHHSYKLQKAFNTYGEKQFVFGVVEFCEIKDLVSREQYYLDTLNPPYNVSKSADKPTLGRKLSEETKLKIGKANSVNRMTPEHFKKFRDAVTKLGCPMKGKTHSQESKLKMSISRKKYLQSLKAV